MADKLDLTELELINEEGPAQLNTSGYKYIGLYFSAQWCMPCKEFTPKLVAYYEERRKRRGEMFEIVFVSSDKDKFAFEDYFSTMPWLALNFEKTERKDDLTDLYDATTLPTLVILKPDGSLVSRDGRKAVNEGFQFESLEA